MATNAGNTIKVVARFRPPNRTEVASGGQSIVEFESEDSCRIVSGDSGAFTFDRVFDTDSRQSDVFDFSIRSTVDDILNGYNGTVFAYGQTGAGKSYTMMGADIDDDAQRGIIPRIVEQIFASILRSPGNIEYTVRVSYMEIYMEKIRDLLVPQNDNLPIHEEKNRGVYVKGLLEIYVSSVQEVFEVMRRGGTARATAATNMNQESSRSHSIFVITVTQKNVESGSAKSGQLFLVDLAGSEKVGKTGASGQTLEEAKKINKSLSALGMVINSLTDGKSTHIPYRDSKLTRILQESLGGNSRTTLIINCSPSSYNDQETLSTLRFGVRAKAIKNKAKVNAELSPAELKHLLKKAQAQQATFEGYISGLEGELQAWRRGDTVSQDRWTPLMSSGSAQTAPAPSRIAESRLDKDEREEFLRRENELQDQVSEKDMALSAVEQELKALRDECKTLKQSDSTSDKLIADINELRMQLERMTYESKEATITMDGLRDANSELTSELDDVNQQLLDLRLSKDEHDGDDSKDRKKAERMAEMMSGFELNVSDSEERIQRCLGQLDAFYQHRAAGELPEPQELENLKRSLLESRGALRQAELKRASDGEEEVQKAEIGSRSEQLAVSRTVQQQIADFDVMKKSLMRDLQNRCERVVELEISLDETREQYKNVLRSSNSRAQQKKMAFLERNLEQLTQVQRQMMEQNGSLKKEVAIAERKLMARNERIGSLEALLTDSQEKLTAANHRFEAQLTAVKERLEAAKSGSTRGLGAPVAGGFSFGGLGGPRIAKPLRGGGTSASQTGLQASDINADTSYGGAGAVTMNGLTTPEGSKRSSWFFSDRR